MKENQNDEKKKKSLIKVCSQNKILIENPDTDKEISINEEKEILKDYSGI